MGTTALICATFINLFLSTLQTLLTLTLFLHPCHPYVSFIVHIKTGHSVRFIFSPSLFCSFLHSWSYCNPAGSQMAQIERERGILNGSHSVMGLKMLKIVALACLQHHMPWEHQSSFRGQYYCCCSSFSAPDSIMTVEFGTALSLCCFHQDTCYFYLCPISEGDRELPH